MGGNDRREQLNDWLIPGGLMHSGRSLQLHGNRTENKAGDLSAVGDLNHLQGCIVFLQSGERFQFFFAKLNFV